MAKKREPVDDVLDAIVWMRRKSKKHKAVDEFIDALFRMRRKTVKRATFSIKPGKDKFRAGKAGGKKKPPVAKRKAG